MYVRDGGDGGDGVGLWQAPEEAGSLWAPEKQCGSWLGACSWVKENGCLDVPEPLDAMEVGLWYQEPLFYLWWELMSNLVICSNNSHKLPQLLRAY